jgi:hypothetical protein
MGGPVSCRLTRGCRRERADWRRHKSVVPSRTITRIADVRTRAGGLAPQPVIGEPENRCFDSPFCRRRGGLSQCTRFVDFLDLVPVGLSDATSHYDRRTASGFERSDGFSGLTKFGARSETSSLRDPRTACADICSKRTAHLTAWRGTSNDI